MRSSARGWSPSRRSTGATTTSSAPASTPPIREARRSPLVACLDAGWQPGLIGCSDEHGPRFGLDGRGRTGLWVHEHSRDGVREALAAGRVFATRERGLRLDASLAGAPLGSALPAGGGRLELAVDLGGSGYEDRPVELQLLTSAAVTGGVSPEVAVVHRAAAVVGDVTTVEVDVPAAADWVLLRVADTSRGYGGSAPAGHPAATWGVAYASPWYLTA